MTENTRVYLVGTAAGLMMLAYLLGVMVSPVLAGFLIVPALVLSIVATFARSK